MAEVVARFGSGSAQRQTVTARLQRIYQLAAGTGALARLVLFGSYVTDKEGPNDVDVVLVMRDDFVMRACTQEALVLFDHARAESELGASIFWVRPSMILLEPLDDFIAGWQRKRDGGKRGIVEVRS
ncbi:MAG TPA: hypothetical protein VFE78_12930 [Gemmataceae bacterium]|nr:hypothetical protein [Gemmataceae bacterium]